MTQYRFTKRDGTFRYEFLDTDQPDAIPRLRELMQLHAAIKAEPVEAPACPLCVGPVCPIIEPTPDYEAPYGVRPDGTPKQLEDLD